MKDSASLGDVCLRLAEEGDEVGLLDLANDSLVRALSFTVDTIDPETHHAWFVNRLSSPDAVIWVAVEHGVLLGTIRYEREGDVGLIGFAVDGRARGRGLGSWLLRATWRSAIERLGVRVVRGVVKVENEASARAFANASFGEAEAMVVMECRCRVFEKGIGETAGRTVPGRIDGERMHEC